MAKPAQLPLITVSVVSHGDSTPLQACLRSMAMHETGERIQLIVTDNLGPDLPNLDPSPWNSLTMIRNDRPAGYARNHNAAFGHARGEFFCVMNPDVCFIQNVFGALIASIEGGKGAIAAPLIVDSSGLVQDSFRKLPSPQRILRRVLHRLLPGHSPNHDYALDEAILRPDCIAGTFMLLRHSTFADLHGFDARYHLYFEDVDLCTRARLRGLQSVVDTGVRVQHEARHSSHRQWRYLLWHLQSMMRFFSSPVYREARRVDHDAG